MLLDDQIKFDNSYAAELEGFYVPWQGDKVPSPTFVKFNSELAEALGIDPSILNTKEGALMLVGAELPLSATPLAQTYAGHQFGGFSPQLGDGRALLIGEIIDPCGKRFDIHLKGSGKTPFSRGGDGKAALGPVLREYLMGEAMHALRIPTTRALAAITTGEQIRREEPLPGAVLARVAASHLRVGTFQFYAARREPEKVRQLADYAIKRHYPELASADNQYLALLQAVIKAQVSLVAKWVSVGFVHGVMNTDNVSISGETIDYGPCAFIDTYDPNAVFSSIDRGGRYAYGAQPLIAQWNLARFAECLIGIIDPENPDKETELATDEINAIPNLYIAAWLDEMRLKLGLTGSGESDLDLINELHKSMEGQMVDFTKLFRSLSDALRGDLNPARSLYADPALFDQWAERWLCAVKDNGGSLADRADAMDRVNPLYIPRNHLVESALQAAVQDGDLGLFDELSSVLEKPFEVQAGKEKYAEPAPEGSLPHKTFCGT